MSAARLLEKLESVRSTGPSKWIARCPGHEDKSPSLSIRECDDGRVLIHCFAQCSALEILQSIGLELRDLFPERLDHFVERAARPFDAMQVLRCTADEVQIAACVTADIVNGKPISLMDFERVQLAAERLHSAVEVASNGCR